MEGEIAIPNNWSRCVSNTCSADTATTIGNTGDDVLLLLFFSWLLALLLLLLSSAVGLLAIPQITLMHSMGVIGAPPRAAASCSCFFPL